MHLSREDLAGIIDSIGEALGIPCAYYQFEDTVQAPPFFVWFLSSNTDVFADNQNFVDKEVLNFELYTSERDFDLETSFEDSLKANGISYSKEAAYVDDEKIWQIAYESEVIIHGAE